jgi:hypothetical protein
MDTRQRLLVVCGGALALGLGACGKKEESEAKIEVAEVGFLASSDLTPSGTVNDMDADRAQMELEYSGDFYLNESDSAALTQGGDCIKALIDALVAEAGENSLKVEADIDMSDCFKTMMGTGDDGPKMTWETVTASMQIGMGLGCDGGDFSDYDGKTLGELTEDDGSIEGICADGEARTFLLNMAMVSAATATFTMEGQEHKFEMEMRNYDAEATADVGPCEDTRDGSTWTFGTCLSVSRSVDVKQLVDGEQRNGATANVEDYSKIVRVGVTGADDKTTRYYASGSFDVTINNWNGTVTNVDGATAPTYKLSNGDETITGTVGEDSSDSGATLLARKRAMTRFAVAHAAKMLKR